MEQKIDVKWHDAGREPVCKPNPAYPNGVDVDGARGASSSCISLLPYPAKRCGFYEVRCGVCGASVAVTTAGRSDDPRSVKIACKVSKASH